MLTNCDAFENFPPKMFVPLFLAAKRPWLTKFLLAPMRLRCDAPLADGLRVAAAATPRRSTDAQLGDAGDDRARDPQRHRPLRPSARPPQPGGPRRRDCATSTDRCTSSGERPIAASRCRVARRLAAAFRDATLIEVADVSTFVSIDAPEAVSDAIVAIATTSVGEST